MRFVLALRFADYLFDDLNGFRCNGQREDKFCAGICAIAEDRCPNKLGLVRDETPYRVVVSDSGKGDAASDDGRIPSILQFSAVVISACCAG